MEEFLEHDTLVKLFHDPLLLFQGKGVQEFLLHFVGEPVDLFLFTDIFEFDAHMVGIAFLQVPQDLPEGGCAQADEVAGKEVLIQVFFGESIESQVEIGASVFARADRVGFGQ